MSGLSSRFRHKHVVQQRGKQVQATKLTHELVLDVTVRSVANAGRHAPPLRAMDAMLDAHRQLRQQRQQCGKVMGQPRQTRVQPAKTSQFHL
jgi:hypothetical protein